MKLTTAIIIVVLTILAFYIALRGTLNYVLYQNQSDIEQAIAETLKAEDVSIGGFVNMPFIFAAANNINVKIDGDTIITLDNIRVYYSVFTILFSGIENGIRRVELNRLHLTSSISPLIQYIRSMADGNGADIDQIPIRTQVVVNNFISSVHIIGQIESEINSRYFQIALDRNTINFDTYLFVNLKLGEEINYLKSGLDFSLAIRDVASMSGDGKINVAGLNLGGIPMFNNEGVEFIVDNGVHFKVKDSPLSNIIVQTNDYVYINLERDFIMHYDPYKEYYVLEHMLDNGNYGFKLNSKIGREDFELKADITLENAPRPVMSAHLRQQGNRVYLKGGINNSKYGFADLDIYFDDNAQLPSGNVTMRNIAFAPGLEFSGFAQARSISNTVMINARNVRLNGGLIGRNYTVLTLKDDGGVVLHSPGKGLNAEVTGLIFKKDYDINIAVNRVPGELIVSNIQVDFFNIGRGIYNGNIRIYNETNRSDITLVAGNLNGFYRGDRLLRAKVSASNTLLTIEDVYFYPNDVVMKGTFDINSPDRMQTYINSEGSVLISGKYRFPFSGLIHSFPKEDKADINFLVDGAIKIDVVSRDKSVRFDVKTKNYSLAKLDLPGKLDVDFSTRLYNARIRQIDTDIMYKINDRYYNVFMRTQPDGDRIAVKNFMFDVDGEKVFARDGILWETPERLNARINFNRGGGISFSSSFEDINGSIDLRNIMIRHFLSRDRHVFASASMNFEGDLIFPDFTMNANLRNSVNSPHFIGNVQNLKKQGNRYNVSGLFVTNKDYSAFVSGRAVLQDNDSLVVVSGIVSAFGSLAGGVNVMYRAVDDRETLSYKVSSLKVGSEVFGDIEGGVIRQDGRHQFYRKTDKFGLSGYYNVNNSEKEWDLDFYSQKLSASFVGGEKDMIMTSKLTVDTDLRLLSFQDDIFKNISGKADVILEFTGNSESPDINGVINLKDTSAAIQHLRTTLKRGDYRIDIFDGRLVFRRFRLPTSTGDFIVDGYVDMSDLFVSYLDLTIAPPYNKNASLNLDINDPFITLSGNFFVNNLRVYGHPLALNVAGNVRARNTSISIGIASVEGGEPNEILDGLVWNLNVSTDSGVRFANRFIETTIAREQEIVLLGSFGNRTFTMRGDLTLSRGTVSYLGRNFNIREGTVNFQGNYGDPVPYVTLETMSYERAMDGENIEIYLTFAGKLTTITLRDFYSVPDRSNEELAALLGLETRRTVAGEGMRGVGADIVVSGVNIAQNYLVFNPFAMRVRQVFGLDMFNIRTDVFGNMIRYTMETNVDPLSMIEGTSLAMGKYLFSNIFLEYEFALSRDPAITSIEMMELVGVHTVGVGLDFRNWYFGWKYLPVIEPGLQIRYENKLELKFHQKF
jgi:hypothetical protein